MKKTILKAVLSILFVALAMNVYAGGKKEAAEKYPSRTITVIVPWSAGGGTDAIARALVKNAQNYLGVPVVVENKPGGQGAVGLAEVMRATPDGYTLAILPVELGFLRGQGIYPFDFSNFTRIMNLNTDAAALAVNANAPWNTFEEFLADAKSRPGKISVGHSGTGLLWHLAALSLADKTGTSYAYVPFDGAGDATAAILGGNLDAMTFSGAEVSAQVKAGNMKILAILGDQRMPMFPDIKTAKEMGYDININTFRGLGGPANIPADRIAVLADAFEKMTRDPDFISVMDNLGLGIDYRNTADYMKLTEDTARDLGSVLKYLEN